METLDDVTAMLGDWLADPTFSVPRTRVEVIPEGPDSDRLAVAYGVIVLAPRGRHVVMREDERFPKAQRTNLLWLFRGDLILTDSGVVVLGSLEVGPWLPEPTERADPFRGVTTDVLRAIKPGVIVTKALEKLELDLWSTRAIQAKKRDASWNAERRQATEDVLTRARGSTQRRGGRTPYGDDHYKAVARAYLTLSMRGQRGIHKQLAEQFGAGSPKTAAEWVREARRRRFLTPGSQGRAGAMPGPLLDKEEGMNDG
jgi:hypothetical protein